MLGLEATGFAIALLFGGVRLYVGYLKRWQPYRIEVFGVITFELAVVFALYVCAHWSSDGVRMVRWRAEGADDNTIRMKLLTSKDFKVCSPPPHLQDGTDGSSLSTPRMSSPFQVCGPRKQAFSRVMRPRIRSWGRG